MNTFSFLPVIEVVILLLLARLTLLVYRVYFHPLSKFPGPRAAAISRSWQAQAHQVDFPEKLYSDLHRKYNTKALRIGPNELHISDVDAYRVVYSQNKPFPKEPAFYDSFNIPHTVFSEVDFSLHKERRKRLNPVFSKSGVTKFEPVMLDKMGEMATKLRSLSKSRPIGVNNMFRCMATDIISELAFASSLNLTHESSDSFDARFLEVFDAATKTTQATYYSPLRRLATRYIPLSFVAKFDYKIRELTEVLSFAHRSYFRYSAPKSDEQTPKHPVIFDQLKGISEHLQLDEAMNILIAGSDTTAHTLTVALYHILQDPSLKGQLRAIVDSAIPDPNVMPSYTELEKIEILRAVTLESIRLAIPVAGILPRIVPNDHEPLIVDGLHVPAGTIVGISAYTMHTSTEIWGPDAENFRPERWFGEAGKTLDAGFVSFGKGSRQCLGTIFAKAEITLTLAYLFRHFDMELADSDLRVRDVFVSQLVGSGVNVRFQPR